MKKFIIRVLLFSLLSCIAGEIIIRTFKLTSDIPQRFIEQPTGLQLYKPGQSGYYRRAKEEWVVNDYGWLGIATTDKKPLFSIIGDSYIENIMNPISCNQGFILQSHFKKYSFFEAGRSGVTFIEALEISKYLDTLIRPTYHLIYIGDEDLNESILSIERYTDRVQVDLEKKAIIKAKMKSPLAKKVLYSSKLLYYMYLKFPLLVEEQNKGALIKNTTYKKSKFHTLALSKLFKFCSKEYDLKKIVLIFHPNTDERIINLASTSGFSNLTLHETNKSWALDKHDGHWSCYGHREVTKQVIPVIDSITKIQLQKKVLEPFGNK